MKILIYPLLALFLLLRIEARAHAYPLDGYDETEINRLDGYFHSLLTDSGLKNLTAGALLSVTELKLSKPGISEIPGENLSFKREIMAGLPSGNLSLSVLDLSDKGKPRYAGINDSSPFVPGSVGKVMIAIALFDALRDLYPGSTEKREQLLRERFITANALIENDEHVVPFWDETNRKIYFRPLQIGDRANIWTYLDWMLSASSNAAAGMVMREVLLMRYFGKSYPPSASEEAKFFNSAPSGLMASTFVSPLARIFGPGRLFQASAFTKRAKAAMPGAGSSATTRDLVRLLLKIENGTLIDEFSSLEMKRLLYLTQHRERYVGVPALDDAAVYFKAGSLYRCGGPCVKYEGTLLNMLNGLVIVEDPVGNPKTRYLVALSTNIVRRNSEDVHRAIANHVHRVVKRP